MSTLHQRWVALVLASPRRALLGLGLALIPAVYLTALYYINVRAALQDLLPPELPMVRAIEKLHERIGGVATLIVIAHGDTPEHHRSLVDALAAELRAAPPPELKALRADVRVERAWIETRAPLLMSASDFDDMMERIEDGIAEAKQAANPLFVRMSTVAEPSPLVALEADLRRRASREDRFPNGYFEQRDGSHVVMILGLAGSDLDIGPASRLVAAVDRGLTQVRAAHPELARVQVAYNGEVQNLIEEHAAIVSDVSLSSALVTLLVGALIAVYFRSARAVLVVIGSVTPGILATFAIGRLSGSVLNSNSAFLGSIIAGNGINFVLVYMAFFRSRPADEPLRVAIHEAATGAFSGTVAAAITASAAYFGLAAAEFRGFSDFGRLGGVGMLMTWLFSFVTAPIWIGLLQPPRLSREESAERTWLDAYFERPRLPALVALIAALAAGGVSYVGLSRALADGPYDMALKNLRNSDSLATGGASWDPKISEIFGVWMNPVAGSVDDPAVREALASALRAGLVGTGTVAGLAERVETIERYVPAADEQARRLARLGKLRRTIDALPEGVVPPDAMATVDTWLSPTALTPITVAEVPESLKAGFLEKDGRSDRTVLLFPRLGIDFDDGRNVIRFVEALEAVKLPEGAVVAGAFLFMAEILRMIRDEGPRVVGIVSALVFLALLPVFGRRPLRILLVLGTVLTVAFVGQMMMFAAGVRLNMLNFAAIPITIGVGADYVVNLLGAMDAYGVGARRAVGRLGSAILVCSATTVIGYVSLLFAHSGALRSFGWAAVLGEVGASSVVLIVLPVLMRKDPAPSA